jgi:hypothetical protein
MFIPPVFNVAASGRKKHMTLYAQKLKLRMRGAKPLFPHASVWCNAQLKRKRKFYFNFNLDYLLSQDKTQHYPGSRPSTKNRASMGVDGKNCVPDANRVPPKYLPVTCSVDELGTVRGTAVYGRRPELSGTVAMSGRRRVQNEAGSLLTQGQLRTLMRPRQCTIQESSHRHLPLTRSSIS